MEEDPPKKRKLNVFDFLQGATETLPTTVVEPVVKRRREEAVDEDVEIVEEGQEPAQRFNHIGFTLDPMAFTPAQKISEVPINDDPQPEPRQDQHTTLSYSEAETLSNINSSRTGFNNYKGKKYGLGAALLQKMGWEPGKGLGASLQGITEPIEMGTHRQGAGIGASLEKEKRREKNRRQGKVDPDDISDEESSDEEYYKEVPKKSLYQLIVEIEALGVVKVPDSIKELSNTHSAKAKKTFIELRKEGGGDEQIEKVTTQLDALYNELSNLVASSKMAEFEKKELQRRQEQNKSRTELYQSLQTLLQTISTVIDNHELPALAKSTTLKEIVTTHLDFLTKVFTTLHEYDISKVLMLALRPTLMELFEEWDPFNVVDISLVENLIQWKTTLSPLLHQEYNELDYFQSLLYSLWYPRITTSFEEWSVSHPNLIITLLLDWGDVLDSSIIDHFIRSQIEPKILTRIDESDITSKEDGPSVWLFEWMPFIHDGEEIKRRFKSKFDFALNHWSVEVGVVPGVKGYKEIVGDVKFEDSLKKKLLPRLVSLLNEIEFGFDGGVTKTGLDVFINWSEYFEFDQFEKLLRHTIMNNWLRSLYHALNKCQKLKNGFGSIASSMQLCVDHFFNTIPSFEDLIKECTLQGLDMINKFIDSGVLSQVHKTQTFEQVLGLLTKENKPQEPEVQPRGIPLNRLQSSFKEVVEDYCTSHNLFITSQNTDLSMGKSLLKISRDVNGKNVLLGYIEEDVLFVGHQGSLFEPISLDDLEKKIA